VESPGRVDHVGGHLQTQIVQFLGTTPLQIVQVGPVTAALVIDAQGGVTEQVSEQIVRLPSYQQMTEMEQSRVIRVIQEG
jgi:dTDP-4-amino-4,6-dideoxygalactose transaminase